MNEKLKATVSTNMPARSHRGLFKRTAPVSWQQAGSRLRSGPTRDPPRLAHRVLLLVLDGPGVVSHEAHGEEEIDDGKDGVQPKEVIAERGHLPSGPGSHTGWGWGGGRALHVS